MCEADYGGADVHCTRALDRANALPRTEHYGITDLEWTFKCLLRQGVIEQIGPRTYRPTRVFNYKR